MNYYTRLLTFLILSNNVNAQNRSTIDTNQLYYEVIRDNPSALYIGMGVDYSFCANGYNTTFIGLGAGGVVNFKNAGLKISYGYHFGEDLMSLSTYAQSVHSPKNSRDLDVLGSFYFRTNESVQYLNVELKHNQKNDTLYFTSVPGKFQKRYGIDIGYKHGFTYYNFGEKLDIEGIDNNGNVVNFGIDQRKTISSYYNFSILKVGFNRTHVTNLKIMTNKYGGRTNCGSFVIYGQLFFNTRAFLDDISVPADIIHMTGPYTQYDINSVGFLKLGGCVGLTSYSYGKGAFGCNVEAGFFPGLNYRVYKNLYLDIKLNFHLVKSTK